MTKIARITLKLTIISLAQPRMAPMIANRMTNIQKIYSKLTMLQALLCRGSCQAVGQPCQVARRARAGQAGHGNAHGLQALWVTEQALQGRQELGGKVSVPDHDGCAVLDQVSRH